jgi:hypothetical protein
MSNSINEDSLKVAKTEYLREKRRITLDTWLNESKWAKSRGVMIYFCLSCGEGMYSHPQLENDEKDNPYCMFCNKEMRITDVDVLQGMIPVDSIFTQPQYGEQ